MKRKSNIDSIDDHVDIDLGQKTEFQGVASEIHTPRISGSNISELHASALFRCEGIFPEIGLEDDNPRELFLELMKSKNGWATDKIVQTTSNMNEQRTGTGALSRLKDVFFTPKS